MTQRAIDLRDVPTFDLSELPLSSSSPSKQHDVSLYLETTNEIYLDDSCESTMTIKKLFSSILPEIDTSNSISDETISSLSDSSSHISGKTVSDLTAMSSMVLTTPKDSTIDILLKEVGYTENDIKHALLAAKYDAVEENKYGRNRPTTHVFYQGKTFTYPKLEVPNPKSSKSKRMADLSVHGSGDGSPVLDPESSVRPSSPYHHIFTSLRNIRIANLNNVIIAQLNINSLRNKFHALKEMINSNIDILVLTETKLDGTFPRSQFRIPGYRVPYRKDRDTHGGGVMIYVREDIPSDILRKHVLEENIEAIFIQVNLKKFKLLLIAAYNSPSAKYRIPDTEFFVHIGNALDVYSGFDRFILGGDLNINVFDENEALDDFLDAFHAKNLVKDPTCYANPANPSCLDIFITNSFRSFQSTTTATTGLSDCHKMVVTVLKTTFPKAEPRIISYRDYSTYCPENFGKDLQRNLNIIDKGEYQPFDDVFINTLQTNHPTKRKTIRANQQSYVTKEMRKGIMNRSRLQQRYWLNGTEESRLQMKQQENRCNKL